MERVKLPARLRTNMSKSWIKELRRNGFIPANLHAKDIATPLEIKIRDLVESTKTEAGTHALLDLIVEGDKKTSGIAMIKDVQKDPVSRRVLHVDLQIISLKEKINSAVPVEVIGEALGLKEGGTLDQVLVEVEVRALPTELPPKIVVDCSSWEVNHVTRAGDLELPEGLELITDPNSVIASIRVPHIHADDAAADAAAAAAAAEEVALVEEPVTEPVSE